MVTNTNENLDSEASSPTHKVDGILHQKTAIFNASPINT